MSSAQSKHNLEPRKRVDTARRHWDFMFFFPTEKNLLFKCPTAFELTQKDEWCWKSEAEYRRRRALREFKHVFPDLPSRQRDSRGPCREAGTPGIKTAEQLMRVSLQFGVSSCSNYCCFLKAANWSQLTTNKIPGEWPPCYWIFPTHCSATFTKEMQFCLSATTM